MQEENKQRKILSVVGLSVLVFLILSAGVYFFLQQNGRTNKAAKEKPPQGVLLLTLWSIKDKNAGIYSYDIARSELKEIYSKSASGPIFSSAALQPGGSLIAFAEKSGGEVAIKTFDVGSKEVKNIIALGRGALDRVTWSPDGSKLAYAFYVLGKKESEATKIPAPEGRRVAIVDLTGRQQIVDPGSSPFFISVDLLVVLKNDGFWQIDLKNGTKKRLLDRPSDANEAQYAFSPDFSMIAWTIPSQKKAYFATINGTETKTLKDIRGNDGLAYSLHFSPDKKYIAGYRIGNIMGNIFYLNIQTLAVRSLLNLPDSLITDKIITDWVLSLP